MKTKLVSILLIIAILFAVAGCGTNTAAGNRNNAPTANNTAANTVENTANTEENTAPAGNTAESTSPAENTAQNTVDETLFTINGYEFHMDKEAEFKGLKYTVSGDFKEVDQSNYIQYNYAQTDGSNLFFFRIFYYKLAGDVKIAIKDLGLDENIPLIDGKTESIEYKFYDNPIIGGGTLHFYFIEHEEDIYAVTFTCKYDIKDFEQKAVNSLKF